MTKFCAACAHCVSFSPMRCGKYLDPRTGEPRLSMWIRELGGPCGPNARDFVSVAEPAVHQVVFPVPHRVSA